MRTGIVVCIMITDTCTASTDTYNAIIIFYYVINNIKPAASNKRERCRKLKNKHNSNIHSA